MGSSSWSDHYYTSRAALRVAAGTPVFAHHAAVAAGKASGVHESLDPAKMKNNRREARDSDLHPQSTPIYVGLDVTGSMAEVPVTVQKKLCSLMGLLLRKGFVTDPAICISAIGDATIDSVPFQVGQFESGIEIENDLTNLVLEGGGGGQQTESYELALYFLARCTATDAWDKRQKKGYAFIIGDEMAYQKAHKDHLRQLFGIKEEADVPLDQLLAEVKERWELFYILPNMTSYYDSPDIKAFWASRLGQNFIRLDNPDDISELIATQIGVAEGNLDATNAESELVSAGVSAASAAAVTKALVVTEGRKDVALTKGTGLATL